MATQSCPTCGRVHDVASYVIGQKVLCGCGIKFEVKRNEVAASPRSHNGFGGGAGGGLEAGGLATPTREASGPALPTERTFIAPAPRVQIPGFELTELLGRGGMGEVWRARQKSLGRTVAVKLLPVDLASDPEFVARFEKESAALAALSHPHIIQIIDRGVAGPHYYFVMEYVEGRSLRELMDHGRPSPQQSLRLIAQVLQAMECAHDTQIIHRDLKPENILVDARGHAKVADFGLAGMRGGDEQLHLTATAVAMGTVNYMAPEQRRDAAHVDGRADLYSVGVILYELLTGELPIGRFRLPSQRVPGLDQRLDAIVENLLQTDPTHRYARAGEVLADLEPLLSVTSNSAPTQPEGPPSKNGTPTEPARRSIILRGARSLRTGLMVIGGLAVIGFAARSIFGPEKVPRVTISTGSGEVVLGQGTTPAATSNAGKRPYPENTDGELMSAAEQSPLEGGRIQLKLSFAPGEEELNAHSGEWLLSDGKLTAIQAGNETDGERLVPRAYVAHRYFSTDDFDAEVEVTLRDVRSRYDVPDDVQRFGELALRIKDLQVSAFAIPGGGMRLGWRYYTAAGAEMAGNSARDLELLVEDETPTPADGATFHLRLQLQRAHDAVAVTAYLNGHPFARKVLPGLQGKVGKVALGCRNYECAFSNLVVKGKPAPRPMQRVAGNTGE
ncbi:MAG TPA: serine/threonine-protein kinase [Myxococcaceae bacterium]|nr:serine/threonine-protein kinase [Myxococcaceae bacterium]